MATKNFASSTVATAPSPATSGTSLVLQTGDGAKFYNGQAWVWPAGVQPLTTNAEVVTITGIVSNTLTITRAQESSSARTVIVGDQIAQGLTAGMYDALYQPGGTDVTVADGGTGASTAASARLNLGLALGSQVQPWDADLDAYAALSASGFVTHTGAGTASSRSIAGTTNRIGVTNGDGVSGNPTLDIGTDVVTLTAAQLLTGKELTAPLLTGGSSPPSTPASGKGVVFGAGTGAVRPRFMNNSANIESIMTSLDGNHTVEVFGFGSLQMSAAQTVVGSAVSFGVTFQAAPYVFVQGVGSKSTAPSSPSDSLGASGEWFSVSATTTTSFVPTVLSRSNTTAFIGYVWRAVGIV